MQTRIITGMYPFVRIPCDIRRLSVSLMSDEIGTKYYTISQASKTIGVSKSTLRRWEKQQKISSKIDENGIHLFAEKDLAPLRSSPVSAAKVFGIPENKMLSVSQAARAMGVSASTLLRWENAGLVTSSRTAGGARRYDPASLTGLQNRALYQRVPVADIRPAAAIDTEAVSKIIDQKISRQRYAIPLILLLFLLGAGSLFLQVVGMRNGAQNTVPPRAKDVTQTQEQNSATAQGKEFVSPQTGSVIGATGATGLAGIGGLGGTGATGSAGTNGTNGTSGSSVTGPTGPTGLQQAGTTAGQTSYWNGSSWVVDSNIYNNGGNVGIGTTAPLAALDVNGTASISGALTLYGSPIIASTAKQSLTLGNANTGNVVFDQSGSVDFSYKGVKNLYNNIITVNGYGGADYTTIASAITAASALTPGPSNLIAIMVYPGTYTETWTLPAYVSLIAAAGGVTCNSTAFAGPAFTFGGSQTVFNITFNGSYCNTTNLAKVTGTAVTFRSVSMSMSACSTGNNYTLWSATGDTGHTLNIYDSVIKIVSAGDPTVTSAYAYYGDSTAARSLTIYNSTFSSQRFAGSGPYVGFYQNYVASGSIISNSVFKGTTNSIYVNDAILSGCSFAGPTNGVFTIDDSTVRMGGVNSFGGVTFQPSTDTLTALVVNDKDANNVLTVDTINNNVGIGTSAPVGKLDVSGAVTGKALAIFNETGDQAIFTASGSGTPRFTIAHNGDIVQTSSDTTGVVYSMLMDSLTTGTGLSLSSTSTGLTTGRLLNVDWTPSSAVATGDLVRINIGPNGTIGNLLNVTDNASTLFSVSESQITNALPVQFSAVGDVGVAYDLVFTNQTASIIDSYGPLTIRSGESFENNNLTLKTYGTGNVVLDTALNSGLSYTTAPWLQLTSSNYFGGTGMGGAWIDWNSAAQEEFTNYRTTVTNTGTDTTGAAGGGMGDAGGWGVYANGDGCTFSNLSDTAGGIMRLANATAANIGCLAMMDEAANNPNTILDADNLPTMIYKVRPSQVDATSAVYVGMGDSTDGVVAAPDNFIGFSNDNAGTLGTSWVGITRSAGVSTTVTCTGATISTTNYAILAVQVRTNADVHFFYDANASDGVSFTECSTGSQTNVPVSALAPQIHWQERTGGTVGTTLDIDYFRAWEDDPPDGVAETLATQSGLSEPVIPALDVGGAVYFSRNANLPDVYQLTDKNGLPIESLFIKHIESPELTDKFAGINDSLARLSASKSAETASPSAGPADLLTQAAGQVTTTIQSIVEFLSDVTFNRIVRFLGKVSIEKEATISGQLTLPDNMAGTAVIRQYTQSVHVTFPTAFVSTPVVTLSLVLPEATQSAFLSDGFASAITDTSPEGFTIALDQVALRDYTYNWIAVSVGTRSMTISDSPLGDFLGTASQSATIATGSAEVPVGTPSAQPL